MQSPYANLLKGVDTVGYSSLMFDADSKLKQNIYSWQGVALKAKSSHVNVSMYGASSRREEAHLLVDISKPIELTVKVSILVLLRPHVPL